MNLYKYQRSRSFIDLDPRSLRFNISNIFSLETARPLEAKFHVAPPWDGRTEVCSSGKTMDFSETIVVYDIKVDRHSLRNEYMKLCEFQRSRSFIDLGLNVSDAVFLNIFLSITTRPIEAKFHMEPP